MFLPCAQDAVVLQPLAGAALCWTRPGCCWSVQVQSGYLLAFSIWFHPAGVDAVRQWKVTQSRRCYYSLVKLCSYCADIAVSPLTLSTQSCQPLVSPGVCVGALAPVDGLSDALIGTDEGGCLFVW